MDATAERTVSGRALVVAGLIVAVLTTAVAVVFGPALRDAVRQEQSPRTLREPVAIGSAGGTAWEAVGRFDGTANCVELRANNEILDRACDTGPTVQTTELGGRTIAYGVAAEDATEKALALDNGDEITVAVHAGELGFPVGFWAVQLPEARTLAETQQ